MSKKFSYLMILIAVAVIVYIALSITIEPDTIVELLDNEQFKN